MVLAVQISPPFSASHRSRITSPVLSCACALFISLCALFRTPILCFQSFADSFAKTPGWGVPAVPHHRHQTNDLPKMVRPLCTLCFGGDSSLFRVERARIWASKFVHRSVEWILYLQSYCLCTQLPATLLFRSENFAVLSAAWKYRALNFHLEQPRHTANLF